MESYEINKDTLALIALKDKTEVYFLGDSAPRGRILDVNGNILVDNALVEQIAYHKVQQPSFEEEIRIAEELLKIVDVSEAEEKSLREYFVQKNSELVSSYITEEERKLVDMRKLTLADLERYKRERIPKEDLESLSSYEKKLAFLYAKMNEGYAYQNKILIL